MSVKYCLGGAAAIALLGLSFLNSARPQAAPATRSRDWPAYGGGPADIRYSDLAGINRSNVAALQQIWAFDQGDGPGATQTQPLVIDGVLYGLTAKHRVFALDAATGKQLWRFDSGVLGHGANRGLVYWPDATQPRLFAAVQSFIYALDPKTGQGIASFGDTGRIDLREGLGREPSRQSIVETTPGIMYKDLLIVGGRDPETLPAPPGDIRAYDVRTGKMRWCFHTIPHPGEEGYGTWPKDAWTYSGAANNWAGMAVDTERGIVYVPTGSAASDFYGADRIGDNLFANTLLALDANTGKKIWHFQAVHHDVWDRDFPSPPNLITVERDGKRIDAVAQTTKSGWVFLFDRTNGRPLFPLETRSYPASQVPGEQTSPTQTLPTQPAPFARQLLTESMLTTRTPEAHEWAVQQFRQFQSAGQFIPLHTTKETIVFPGFDGGSEWGGSAVDPQTGILYVNANDLPWYSRLAENKGGNSGRQIYLKNCGVCHGEGMTGAPPQIPSLKDLSSRKNRDQVHTLVRQGAGRMPSFPNLSDSEESALLDYLFSGEDRELASKGPSPTNPRYLFTGYHRFVDPQGYPGVAPPWGTLNAINLNTGEYVWKIPFGQYPELAAAGMSGTGTESYGGPIVTAGGLLFIGASSYDDLFHAYDKSTGKLLWQYKLPAAGNATPITYEVNGRQYVVILATGGYARRTAQTGNSSGKREAAEVNATYVAFALPEKGK